MFGSPYWLAILCISLFGVCFKTVGGGGVNLRVETGAQFTSQCKAVFCPAGAKDNILDSELIFFISASTVAHCRILR